MATTITIDQESLDKIKSVIGWPRITKVVYDDDQIKELVINDVLRTYYNKFPLIVQTQQPVAELVTIPFLDETTFGISNIQFTGKGGQGGSTDSFWDVVRWQIYTGWSMTGQYGIPRYSPNGLNDTFFNKNNQLNTVQNKLTTQDVRVDTTNRIITVYSGVTAYCLIYWAKYSWDFKDVKFSWYPDVIKLCQSKLLDLTAKTVGLIEDSDIAVRFNPDAMKSEAAAMTQEVMDRWAQIPGTMLYRVT